MEMKSRQWAPKARELSFWSSAWGKATEYKEWDAMCHQLGVRAPKARERATGSASAMISVAMVIQTGIEARY